MCIRDRSSHIHVEYQDPVANPDFYQQYTDENINMNSMIVESDRRYTVIDYADIYEYEYDYSSYTSTLTGYDGEGLITSAIAYVTSDDIPTMYVLEGQDELTLSTTFQDGLSKQNVTSESLNLLTADSVPEAVSYTHLDISAVRFIFTEIYFLLPPVTR